jgi:hypothetical protein
MYIRVICPMVEAALLGFFSWQFLLRARAGGMMTMYEAAQRRCCGCGLEYHYWQITPEVRQPLLNGGAPAPRAMGLDQLGCGPHCLNQRLPAQEMTRCQRIGIYAFPIIWVWLFLAACIVGHQTQYQDSFLAVLPAIILSLDFRVKGFS